MSARAARAGGLALALLLAWLVAYPIGLVLLDAARDADGWTLAHVREFLARPRERGALWGSVWISLATVAGAALVGVPLAWATSAWAVPGRGLLGALLALPAVLPPLVGVLAFLFLYGETGLVARLVQAGLRLDEPPWRLSGAGAVLLVHVYSTYVYFFLFVRAALASLDPALLEAAASLGASRGRVALRVLLPQLRPALTGAALLAFMVSLGSFSAPYLFGGPFRVMTTQIVSTRLNGDYALAMVETVALTAVALLALWLLGRLDVAESAPAVGKSGGRLRPRRLRGAARWAAPAALWLAALVAVAPLLCVLLVSFVPLGGWRDGILPDGYTLANYATLVADPVRLRPLLNSLWMGVAATAAALGLAVAAAVLVVRRRVPARRVIEALLALPWAVPGTVFAIAIATMFSVKAPWAGRWVLVGTALILPFAYVVRILPIVGRAALAGFRRFDPRLEEAAASLGAGRWRTLRRVTLPVLAPALLAGAALAFVGAYGDFVVSIVLYTYDTRPVTLEILGSLRQSDIGVAAAYGVVLMAIGGAVMALARADR